MPPTTPATWIDLLDPTEAELREALPAGVHEIAIETYLRRDEDAPRPRLVPDGSYLFGALVIAVVNDDHHDQETVTFQEVDLYVSMDLLVTIRKTPPKGGEPFPKEACAEAIDNARDAHPGRWTYLLFDAFAEAYLDLIDAIHVEIDVLEDDVETAAADDIRVRISGLRHDLLQVRHTLSPFRDLVRAVVDDRIELDDAELFTRDLEVLFGDAYDKMLRASEGLDLARDLISGVRDYAQAKLSIDQNEVMKRLTVVASLLLVPTLIAGIYGQNFVNMPEIKWHYGYLFSWGLIVVTSIAQVIYFRRKKWI